MTTADVKAARHPVQRDLAPLDPQYCVTIPASAATLAGFRAWSASDDFPDTGRITYLAGEIIVDMSPERINSHGQVKLAVTLTLGSLIRDQNLGKFYPDGGRLVNEDAEVSNEPDAMFARWQTLKAGKLRPVLASDEKDYIEMEGTPDWVLEIVSPSSVVKDTKKLRQRYHQAGIPEYWLIDARGEGVSFEILVHQPAGYQSKRPKSGWQKSAVFGKQFRLTRHKDEVDDWAYQLEMK